MTKSAHEQQGALEFYRDHVFQPPGGGENSLSRTQLPLGFAHHDSYTFESYIPGRNGQVVGILRDIANGSGRDNVYLWAGAGAGKTHLLQAICNLAARSGRPCACIPLTQLEDFTPALFSSLEELSLVCLDDVDALAGRDAWEAALFDLFNRLKDTQTPLVMSAGCSPKGSLVRLPDLKSRLSWGLCYHLEPLEERDKITALKLRAQERGFELSDQVVEYLLKRVERDTRSLFRWLDRLDRSSLQAQRKLTVNFVKQILEINENTLSE